MTSLQNIGKILRIAKMAHISSINEFPKCPQIYANKPGDFVKHSRNRRPCINNTKIKWFCLFECIFDLANFFF